MRTVVCVILLLLTGVSVRAETDVVRVATLPNDSGAQVYYAADMGFFKKVGLDVRITTLNSGSLISSGVASGTFDIGQSALSSIASAYEHGLPFVIMAPSGLWTSDRMTSALVVAKDSPIRTARDLSGKTVAVNALQTVTQVGPEAWLDQSGGDASAVKFVELPFPAMPAAVAAHRVDAAVITQPFLDESLKNGGRVLATPYDSIAKAFMLAAWFSTRDYLKSNPVAARKFADVMIETARWANAHPAESARILEKYQKVAVPSTMPRVRFATTMSPQLVQPLIDASAKYHALQSTFPAENIIVDPRK